MSKRVYFWIPLVYGSGIIIVSLLPLNSGEGVLTQGSRIGIRWDYLAHFAIFVPFMVLLRVCLGISFRTDWKKAVLWILIAVLLALGSEWLQRYLPYRGYNVNDIVANVIGVFIGSIIFLK